MKKLLFLAALLTIFVSAAEAQWRRGYPTGRVYSGSGAPTSPAAPCSVIGDVGNVYARNDGEAVGVTFYVCANTAAATYAWELASSPLTIDGLTFELTGPSDGQVICYDGVTDNRYENCDGGIVDRADDDGTVALLAGDRGRIVTSAHATANAVSIAQAGTAGFADGYYTTVCVEGAGPSTITPTTSTIKPVGNAAAATLVIQRGQCAQIRSDGTNYLATVYNSSYLINSFDTNGAHDPADSTVYYNGARESTQTTWITSGPLFVPRAGTVVELCMSVTVITTLGSAETATVVLRKNDTTDTTESIALIYTANTGAAQCVNITTAFTVAQGDRISTKITTPGFTTNPIDVMYSWTAKVVY